MAESLAGKRALVTGAGARIGSRVALRLASQGVAVGVHHFRSEAGARAVVDEIRAAGGEAVALACDLGKEDGPRALAAAAIEALGHLEILVQCASRWEKTPVEEIDERSLDRALAVDLRAPVLLSTLLGRRMREEAGGAIVHLLDWSVERPYPAYLPYGIAKAGLAAATRGLARALAPKVRVNGVAPGAALLAPGIDPETAEAIRRAIPMQRIGEPDDVVDAILYLLTAPYATGTILTVDGGRSLR